MNIPPHSQDESLSVKKSLIEAVLRNLTLKEIPCQISSDGNYLSIDGDSTSIILPTRANEKLDKQLILDTFLFHPVIKSFVFAIVSSDSSVVYYRVYRGLGDNVDKEGDSHAELD
jgi:hypothetical protein